MARLGLAAGVGPDLPDSCSAWLQGIGVDTSGLVMHARPTPRAWQVFEEDGRRTQVWHVWMCGYIHWQQRGVVQG